MIFSRVGKSWDGVITTSVASKVIYKHTLSFTLLRFLYRNLGIKKEKRKKNWK